MSDKTNSQPVIFQTFRIAALFLALYAFFGGIISLLGWVLDIPRLADWINFGISIQPNAALAVTFAGLSVLCFQLGKSRVAGGLALVVAAIGASSLFQIISGIDLVMLNTLLAFDRTWGQAGVVSPGRMGTPGATSWALVGTGLFLLSLSPRISRPNRQRRVRLAAVALSLITLAISSLSITGYLYGASSLYTIPLLTVIALQTATFVFAVSAAIILSVTDVGPGRLLAEDGPAGVMARRIVPALLVVPITLGFFRLAGERAGLYDLAFGTSARTLIEIIFLLVLFAWTARAIRDQTDRLRLAHDELEERVGIRTSELAQTNTALEIEIEERRSSDQARVELLHRIVTAQEDERQRIARDLHDQLGQRLTALRLKLAAVRSLTDDESEVSSRITRLQEIAATIDKEVSFLSTQLRPSLLDDLGLEEALKAYTDDWARHYDIGLEFHSNLSLVDRIPKEAETHFYRIAQEGLNNIVKHANARKVSVLLERTVNTIVLVIEDDGSGFDQQESADRTSRQGLGLVGMLERANLIGADLEIESENGSGTTIYVRLPVVKEDKDEPEIEDFAGRGPHDGARRHKAAR